MEPAYTDVTDTSLYFFKAVQWASEQGLVEGETFDPYAGCTRAMAVYFMWVAADSPEAAASSFTDVAADADYAGAVNWAVAQGVTLGTGDGSTFSPDTVCQRGQIVTFLYRAANAAACSAGSQIFSNRKTTAAGNAPCGCCLFFSPAPPAVLQDGDAVRHGAAVQMELC